MRSYFKASLLAYVLLLTPAAAQDTVRMAELDWDGARSVQHVLKAVLEESARKSGIPIVLGEGVAGRISVRLTGVTPEAALRQLTRSRAGEQQDECHGLRHYANWAHQDSHPMGTSSP